MKPIKLTVDQWENILEHVASHHPASVRLLRSKMRKTLGFTPRFHEEWIVIDHTGDRERKMSETTVHLDFYDEAKRTMFLLKYSDCIGKK